MPVRKKNCNCRNSRCLKLCVSFHRLLFLSPASRRLFLFFPVLKDKLSKKKCCFSSPLPPLPHSYCECFASGLHCERCNCTNCCNNLENAAVRQEAVEATLERNPNAFRPKIAPNPGAEEETEGVGRHNKVVFFRTDLDGFSPPPPPHRCVVVT